MGRGFPYVGDVCHVAVPRCKRDPSGHSAGAESASKSACTVSTDATFRTQARTANEFSEQHPPRQPRRNASALASLLGSSNRLHRGLSGAGVPSHRRGGCVRVLPLGYAAGLLGRLEPLRPPPPLGVGGAPAFLERRMRSSKTSMQRCMSLRNSASCESEEGSGATEAKASLFDLDAQFWFARSVLVSMLNAVRPHRRCCLPWPASSTHDYP